VPSAMVRIEASIVAGNGLSDVAGLAWDDCANVLGVANFAVNCSGSTLTGITAPGLGPLQNNGGPTLTHDLLFGSPAVGRALKGPATDQRGLSRPEIPNSGYDAGAVEKSTTYVSGVM